MPRPTLTRYHVVAIVAALLAVIGLTCGIPQLIGVVLAFFILIVGVGVAWPMLSLFGPYVCRGDKSRRVVALTFDDGPDIHSTPALLDLLRESGVKAAFFCIGNRVQANPELAKHLIAEGHLVENHSYIHSNATNFFSTGRLKSELEQAQEAIRQATGTAPKMFRPPMGLSNPRIFHVARSLGLTVVGWTARGFDTRFVKPKGIVRHIMRQVRPGAIILLHDGNIPAGRLVETVKLLLDRLRSLGYEVERLDSILK